MGSVLNATSATTLGDDPESYFQTVEEADNDGVGTFVPRRGQQGTGPGMFSHVNTATVGGGASVDAAAATNAYDSTFRSGLGNS